MLNCSVPQPVPSVASSAEPTANEAAPSVDLPPTVLGWNRSPAVIARERSTLSRQGSATEPLSGGEGQCQTPLGMACPLRAAYPWIQCPLVVCSPMLRIAQPALAVSVSQAGGIGFVAGGYDADSLAVTMKETASRVRDAHPPICTPPGVLPIGVGFVLWGCDLERSVKIVQDFVPAAVWLFAGSKLEDYQVWSQRIREATAGKTKVWIQVAGVKEGLDMMRTARPAVLVAQGSDAGGHGLKRSASVISLVPELRDALNTEGFGDSILLAAGGIVDGRGTAAALSLGADGVVMGTRFLASNEALISAGYQEEILQGKDGGVSTIRSRVFDRIRETNGWPQEYDGRAFINQTYWDAENGMPDEVNIRLQKQEIAKGDSTGGPEARTIRYVGTGVGIIKRVVPAAVIVRDTLLETRQALSKARGHSSNAHSAAKL